MKILTGYLLREHVGPFVAALGVLTGLMLLNQLAKRFGELVGKGLPWHLIAQVFGLSIPFIVAMTMPMAVLVAVLYPQVGCYSRPPVRLQEYRKFKRHVSARPLGAQPLIILLRSWPMR